MCSQEASSAEIVPRAGRVALPGISSRAWEHPADRGALVALRAVPGYDVLLRTFNGLLRERSRRLIALGSAVRVGPRQFPRVDRIYTEALRVLDVPDRPELYVELDPYPNASAIGMDTPFVLVTSALLDLLDDSELLCVLGHEIGHVRSGHALYKTMLRSLIRHSTRAGLVPFGAWGARAVLAALQEWSRKAELTADRAGLLASQDADAVLRTHMKLAAGTRLDEMDVVAFLEQAEEYESAGDLREGVLKLLITELQSHPFHVERAAEVLRWVRSGEYDRIVRGDYPRRDGDRTASISEEARAAARSYKDGFDASADPLVRTLRDLGGGVSGAVNGVRDAVSGWIRGSRDQEDGPGGAPGPAGPAAGGAY